jgi:hypothetical protein
MNEKARAKRIKTVLFVAVPVLLLAVGYAAWRHQTTFPQTIEQEVRAALPIGTPRSTAEAWAVQNFKFIPTYQPSDARALPLSKSLMGRAGVPVNMPGGVVPCVAKQSDLLGIALDSLQPNHVWTFLLLDREGRVYDYRFLSFAELRRMEREEAAAGS